MTQKIVQYARYYENNEHRIRIVTDHGRVYERTREGILLNTKWGAWQDVTPTDIPEISVSWDGDVAIPRWDD